MLALGVALPPSPQRHHLPQKDSVMPRIALVHLTRVAIDPVEQAARQNWLEVKTISILEESRQAVRRIYADGFCR